MSDIETISCEVCGSLTQYLETKRCNNCWEVERRIDQYLKSKKGLDFIHNKLVVLDMCRVESDK